MKVTQMPPVYAANLVANCGNTAYGVDVKCHSWWDATTYWQFPTDIFFFILRHHKYHLDSIEPGPLQ